MPSVERRCTADRGDAATSEGGDLSRGETGGPAGHDAAVLGVAVAEGRVLVTNNVIDFEALRRARQADEAPVPLLIYTSGSAFPRDRGFTGRLVSALEVAARTHAVAACGGVLWLQPAAGD